MSPDSRRRRNGRSRSRRRSRRRRRRRNSGGFHGFDDDLNIDNGYMKIQRKMIAENYDLPPQNLGNLSPNRRIEFVRAKNSKNSEIPKPPESPEATTTSSDPSGSDFGTFYGEIIEKSKKSVKKEEISTISDDEDEEIQILEVVKKEEKPGRLRENSDFRDVNGFLKAAKDADLDKIRGFLRKKVPIDVTDFYGWTATMCAAAEGNFEICKYLLENGADPGVRDKTGCGIMEIARKKGKRVFVERLFDYFCNGDRPSTSREPEKLSFCEGCDVFIEDSSISEHVSTIVHQLNDKKCSSAAPQSGIQIGPSNIGYRLMCASGWTEEKGLGRNSDGHRFPIRTILKRNRTGLGMEKTASRITHFGPFDKNAVKTERIQKEPVTKKDLEEKKRKEDRIAKRFRSDFSDSDSVFDYFNGKS